MFLHFVLNLKNIVGFFSLKVWENYKEMNRSEMGRVCNTIG